MWHQTERGKNCLLCFVLFPCGCEVPTEGETFLPCLPMHVAGEQCGAPWSVEVLALSQLPNGVAGTRRIHWGLFRWHTWLVLRSLLLTQGRAGDVSPFPLFLGVSVGATVSLTLSWPGASQQRVGFLSDGMVIPLIILHLNNFSFKIWLPAVGKNKQDSGRFNFINRHKSFPFWL